MSTVHRPAEVFTPGEYLRDELEERGWTVTEFAQILGRPLQAISEILNGKKEITAETAVDLGAALDTSPELWLNLQSAYRLHQVRTEEPEPSAVHRRSRLRAFGPVMEMRRRGWLPDTDDLDVLEDAMRVLFEVESLEDVPALEFAARRSNAGEGVTTVQLAWLAQVRRLAARQPVGLFDMRKLKALAASIPERLRDGPVDLGDVIAELAACGIVVVVEAGLKGSKLDGAALFTSDGVAVVGLTARYDRFDSFVFTLLHELAHLILRHVVAGSRPLVDEDIDTRDVDASDIEREANEQASRWIFPDGFRPPRKGITVAAVAQLANQYGIHPSLVIGRLQRDGLLDWSRLRNYIPKVRSYIEWQVR